MTQTVFLSTLGKNLMIHSILHKITWLWMMVYCFTGKLFLNVTMTERHIWWFIRVRQMSNHQLLRNVVLGHTQSHNKVNEHSAVVKHKLSPINGSEIRIKLLPCQKRHQWWNDLITVLQWLQNNFYTSKYQHPLTQFTTQKIYQ